MTLIDLTTPALRDARLDTLPIAIISAGPIGLAAAAHLVECALDFIIYEAGPAIGSSMRSWGHIRLFSPWEHLIDPAARRLLEATGWTEPLARDSVPTGAELVEHYLTPLAALEQIAPASTPESRSLRSPVRAWTAPGRMGGRPHRSRSASGSMTAQ